MNSMGAETSKSNSPLIWVLKKLHKLYSPVVKEDRDYLINKSCVQAFCETEEPTLGIDWASQVSG